MHLDDMAGAGLGGHGLQATSAVLTCHPVPPLQSAFSAPWAAFHGPSPLYRLLLAVWGSGHHVLAPQSCSLLCIWALDRAVLRVSPTVLGMVVYQAVLIVTLSQGSSMGKAIALGPGIHPSVPRWFCHDCLGFLGPASHLPVPVPPLVGSE